MEKVLFITNRLRPSTNAEAFQSTMIAKYLSENCEVHVLSTTETPTDIGKSVHHFIPSRPDRSFGSKMDSLNSRLGRNVKATFPDAHAGWVFEAVRKASTLITDKKIDTVITRSMPTSTHLIGLQVKEHHPGVRWVASMSDPMSINPYVRYSSKALESRIAEFEKDIFAKADIVTHSNSFAIEAYRRTYGNLPSKHIVLSNMFDREPVVKIRHIRSGDGPMLLTYAGRFYGRRTPEALFKAIRMFLDSGGSLKLNIVGAGKSRRLDGLVKKYGLSDIVEHKPFLEPEQLAALLVASHILVTIDGDFPEDNIFLPSKIIDYLSMTVPILGITKKGPTATLIEETRTGYWMEPSKVEGISQLLENHLTKVKEGYDFSPDYDAVMAYHAKNVMNKFWARVK
ncbi:MAG TPA: hypothetical protein DCY35_11810 [Prolixibacteraceae bacterium]|nr:hypothetical protein [Prolixibacteraceae bacterium]